MILAVKNKIYHPLASQAAKWIHNGLNSHSIIGHPRTQCNRFSGTCLPSYGKNSVLSVGKLCNEGYSVTFTIIDNVTIFNKIGKSILKGLRDFDTGLWRINLRKEIQHNTGALVNYLHKAMLSPTKEALLKAVKQGHRVTWPGLTEDAINKHLKLTPATAMGHMNQKRQNIYSTSKAITITSDLEDTTVTPEGTGDKTLF
jgi:hypothetical protein